MYLLQVLRLFKRLICLWYREEVAPVQGRSSTKNGSYRGKKNNKRKVEKSQEILPHPQLFDYHVTMDARAFEGPQTIIYKIAMCHTRIDVKINARNPINIDTQKFYQQIKFKTLIKNQVTTSKNDLINCVPWGKQKIVLGIFFNAFNFDRLKFIIIFI